MSNYLRVFVTLLIPTILFYSCSTAPYQNIPEAYHAKLDEAMLRAGSNAGELRKAIANAPAEQAEAVAFLIAYMPERDLLALPASFILENVEYAYQAKNRFAWGKTLPNEVFFNDVLPYCVLNETRDNWRKDFYQRFAKYLEGVTEITAAIDSVNKHIRNELLVDYNTQREKPDQSPYESMRQNMASCSGLSILLTDAFRAVAIPSRIAGTPNWYDNAVTTTGTKYGLTARGILRNITLRDSTRVGLCLVRVEQTSTTRYMPSMRPLSDRQVSPFHWSGILPYGMFMLKM